MRHLRIFLTQIILLAAWSGLSVPAGHAYRGTADVEPCYGPYLDQLSEESLDPNLDYVPDQILVRFKSTVPEQQKLLALTSAKASQKMRIEKLNVTLVNVAPGEMENSLALLKKDPRVVYAEPNYIARTQEIIPNDQYWSRQYNLRAIRAPQGWELSIGGSAAIIAVVDTGVDLAHPDLSGKLVAGCDFVSNDNDPNDTFNGHGTHVAGIAAAASSNGTGIAGVSWGARIMPVRVLNSSGGGSFLNVARGIMYAADHGAQVINLSLGGYSTDKTLEDAIDYALSKKSIIVAATGNDGIDTILYPALYDGVIAVGGTDSSNSQAWFSNFGDEIDLVAPGDWIFSLKPNNKYGYLSGTSMATPHVAGLAAILVSLPGNSASLVKAQMENSALDLGSAGWDTVYGHGLIQMDAAIRLAHGYLPLPTPLPTSQPPSSIEPTSTKAAESTIFSSNLPDTGFPQNSNSIETLPDQPLQKGYTNFDELVLEIPALKLKMAIAGVPRNSNGWDLTWLGERAGWLEGTAFPTWSGNSLITAHVWDAKNQPGPFFQLKNLKYGDAIRIQAWGQTYTYQVRENQLISATSSAKAFQHESLPWISLLTCEGYNPDSKGYSYRRLIRAVLVDVEGKN